MLQSPLLSNATDALPKFLLFPLLGATVIIRVKSKHILGLVREEKIYTRRATRISYQILSGTRTLSLELELRTLDQGG